jgi:hypothetical protein
MFSHIQYNVCSTAYNITQQLHQLCEQGLTWFVFHTLLSVAYEVFLKRFSTKSWDVLILMKIFVHRDSHVSIQKATLGNSGHLHYFSGSTLF